MSNVPLMPRLPTRTIDARLILLRLSQTANVQLCELFRGAAVQRLLPGFWDFANVAKTEPDPAGGFCAGTFFGLRFSLLECCWPLAMETSLGYGTRPCYPARRVECCILSI